MQQQSRITKAAGIRIEYQKTQTYVDLNGALVAPTGVPKATS